MSNFFKNILFTLKCIKRYFKKYKFQIVILFFLVLFFEISNVNVRCDSNDEFLILNFFKLPVKKDKYSKRDKILLIKEIVQKVSDFGEFLPLPSGIDKNLQNFIKFKRGLCFDRAIIYEKIFKYYGFKMHHYYIGFNNSKLEVLFSKKTVSHTIISIEIGEEELFIDSNNYFLSIDNNDNIIKNFFIKLKLGKIRNKALWWTSYFKEYESSLFIRGLYSRNGNFFKPYLPIPEINFYDLNIIW